MRLSLDPIRAYSDLQVSPWEDSQFFDLNQDGNLTTIPVFSGKYDYEFFLSYYGSGAGSFCDVTVGPGGANEKSLAYFRGEGRQFSRVSLTISNIENATNIVGDLSSCLLKGTFRRRVLRIL